MSKPVLTAIEKATWGRSDEDAAMSKLAERMHRTGVASEQARTDWHAARKTYYRDLRSVVMRKARKITVELLRDYHPEVEIYPLHNGIINESSPLLTISARNKGFKLDLSCMAVSAENVEKLLAKFRAMVAIEAESRKEGK